MNPISNPALLPPGGVGAPASAPAPGGTSRPAPSTNSGKGSFSDVLEQVGGSQPLKFSGHALARVQRRGIELDASKLQRLTNGVQRAADKGSRDSVVLVDGTAFVVSVQHRTVITAVGAEHMKDNVFTNIDSAVIA